MFSRLNTVSFQGVDVITIDVQVQISSGMPGFMVVGLPDKAVGESRERVRSAFHAMGLSLPYRRITVNLAPADVQKEGSHYDLPIALGLLAVLGVIPSDVLSEYVALGELALDSRLAPISGVLPAALHAASLNKGLICPKACGSEAAWAGDINVLAAENLLSLINHFKGIQILSPPEARMEEETVQKIVDLRDVKGQETAKRALEITASGGHNLLMVGPPGAGKSMLAARLAGILPPLTPSEALEVTMIHSLAGQLNEGKLLRTRPFRDPHHSASMPALVGGGLRAKPGEISLAHNGVLFLDELPEFARPTLEALRQPLESGKAVVSRANAHFTYPARVQLIAAMNPCRCGYLSDPSRSCARAPKCALDYQSKISGPLFDRIDLHVELPEISAADLTTPATGEYSSLVADRVKRAREVQEQRYSALGVTIRLNAHADGEPLDGIAAPDEEGQALLKQATEKFKLSARGYRRVLRVARTTADMTGSESVLATHIAEALSYRRIYFG
ncbi:MAG: YifB family Mg chelatase-like AAA ATPase [Alphaproteobacteria bacterium]|nr:YifB family Mg chelatase-like AAA ATPase [Alphaproteobacteria bacterium]